MKNNLLLYLLTLIFIPQVLKGQEIVKPNIIIFYTDDLGWQDTELDYVGGTPVFAETPNILSLAAEGAQFSQAYSPAPTCAPSRGGVLSGRHPIKTKLTQVSGGQLPELKKAKAANKLMSPFFPKRLHENEVTIAEVLRPMGYKSGHIGKWHVAGDNGFPEAIHQGFDIQNTTRGMHRGMNDRFVGYATNADDDPYRIDEDGRPFDEVTEEALAFIETNKDQPFFMYMATWLVHTPIQTRDIALLTYYCDKLGIPVPTQDIDFTTGGQSNPYYGAMIATVDWSLGKIVDYLKETDDPRNVGKKLFETTYIIFSSDNGASEMDGDEVVTDNYPLDLGKTSAKEGGVRVPLVITGPDILVAEYDNLSSGLDFYPTILSMTGTIIDDSVYNDLDGGDLYPLLKGESSIIKQVNGEERTDLYWHYPHGDNGIMRSSIRSGDYKLYKVYGAEGTYYEAFQLYNGDGSPSDLEEMDDVINTMPEAIKNEMIFNLETFLTDHDARLPTWNPDYDEPDGPLENQHLVPKVTSVSYDQGLGIATATIANGSGEAAIASGYLLYRKNEEKEEWFEAEKVIVNGSIIKANVPDDASKIVFNLRDENDFLVLSNEHEVVNTPMVTLNVTENEQLIQPESTDVYGELVGNATANSAYIQMKTEGGGDGFNILVGAVESVLCEKIIFRVRAREGDTVNFNVSIGNETQSFEYTSTKDTDDFYYEFNTPITFTRALQSMDLLVTDLTNSNAAIIPRFRIYDIIFHLDLSSLSLSDVENKFQDLMVFPNPTKGVFSLNKMVESGVLYDLSGAKILEFSHQYQNINISDTPPGLYFLQVTDSYGHKKTLKLLKK